MGGRGGPPEPSEEQLLELRYRAKAEIRKRVRAIRRALPVDARAERATRIAERVRALDAWSNARVVAAYVAMKGEADPAPLVQAARAENKTVVLPRIEPAATMMTWHVAEEDTALVESGYGFDQPAAEAPAMAPGDIDLVLVPTVAVDARGFRIGMGGGYYDRALVHMTSAVRVAMVYDFQLMAEVPETPGDETMHVVVSDGPVYDI